MIRAMIVDDERLARQELRNALKEYSEIEIIAECQDPQEAIKEIEALNPDLLFLDIQMPGKTGFQVLEELDRAPEVIFVTAYDEYALQAFEVSAMDYLVKPVEHERLSEAIKRVLARHKEREEVISSGTKLGEADQVFVKDGEKCWFVQLADVRLFESEGNYVKVHFGTNKPMILRSLNTLDEKLDDKVFFRANRKHIINLKWVEKTENWFNGGLRVTLRGDEVIEISRRQAAKLKDMMSL